ncbi:MAG: hypothetical protein HZC41_08465 [Chloroflexi bacterium]|nr:hypothetical protein [Chloroflexota bacterium]
MAWKDITIPEREELLKLYDAGDTEAIALRAVDYGMKPQSLERKLRDHRYYKRLYLKEAFEQVDIPASPSRQYLDYEEIEADDAIIISDIEVPDFSPLYLLLVLLTAMWHGIKRLIIAGDFIASDQEGINHWAQVLANDSDLGYESSRNLVVLILRQMFKWFDEIVLTGNSSR